MKKFDEAYVLLKDMVEDTYYPSFLVDKIRAEVETVIVYLESGETNIPAIQEKLDAMTIAINNLEAEFDENDSEIETVARESIGATVNYILSWFGIDIDTEEAIRERDW